MKIVKYAILITVLSFLFIGSIDSAQAALTCSVKTSCETGEVSVFKMSALSNAHAETSGSYPYSVCCSGVTGLGTNCGAVNKAVVLRIFGTTNAHIEKSDQTTSGYSDVCLSVSSGPAINCVYTSGSCSSGACIASISADTNAHVGDCVTDPYDTKICCSIENVIVVETEDASVSGANATLNGYLENDGGEACTVSFDWGDTDSYGGSASVAGQKVSGNSFSAVLNSLPKGKLYHFIAKAQNSTLNGSGSEKTFFVLPDAPTGLSASVESYDQINLTWTKGVGAATTIIRRSAPNGSCPADETAGQEACGGPISGTSCSDTGLVENSSYCYRAWSLASDEGEEAYSSGYSEDSANTLPRIDVITLSASNITGTSAILNGRLNNDGDLPCSLWFNLGDNLPYTATTSHLLNQRSVVDFGFLWNGLTKGRAYHFQAAGSNAGDSDAGEDVIFITIPDAPTGLSASVESYNQVDLVWTKGAGAATTIIRRSTPNGSCPADETAGQEACGGPISGTSCSDTGLVENSSYCYRAWSLASDEGEEAYSSGYSEDSANTPSAPAFNFTISLNPSSASINSGSQAVSTVTITLLEGEVQPIVFSTSQLPSGITALFSPASCTPNTSCNSTMTISTTAEAPLGSYAIEVYGNGGGKEEKALFNLTVKIVGALVNPPIVATNEASSITSNSAYLNGTLIDMGEADSVWVWFEWGTTTEYGNITSPVQMTAEGPIAPVQITGLISSETYYFKAMAKSGISW